ncbi:Long-chain-fatty-acid--CoA ligase ACSBG2 [Lemmus lemmus]
MGFNSMEWVIASIGAIMAGGISVGILGSSSPKACQVIAEASEMDIILVDNDKQLQKVKQIQDYLKHLKAIIQYREDIQEVQPNLYTWKGFLDLADGISDEKLDQIIDSQKPNQCCALVYNQGTIGPPKLMMLSHDNITWTTAATVQSLGFKCPPGGQEVLVSYLPLCFAGVQILDVWVAISVAGTVYFPSSEAEKGFLTEMLREVQPTTFCGIPWVWDRMLDNLKAKHLDATAFRRKIDRWAMRMGLSTNRRRLQGQIHQPLCFGLAKRLTFDSARKFLGLNHCQQFLNLGQRLPKATMDFFLSLDIPIFELYGLTESSGLHSLSSHQAFRLLSCGKTLPNCHTKVEKVNQEGIGTLCIWGRHIFMGYLNDKESTEKKMDNQGWLHTSDLGFLDVDKFLYVMGNSNGEECGTEVQTAYGTRKNNWPHSLQEGMSPTPAPRNHSMGLLQRQMLFVPATDIITLSSGEVVNPNPIEERVKTRIPIVRYVMLVGQDAPYLCALLTLKVPNEMG